MGRRETVHRERAAEPLKSGGSAGVLEAGGLVGLEKDFRDCVEDGALWERRHLTEGEEEGEEGDGKFAE
jgi:hypothetical protein